MELTDTGFDASVLSEFRARLVDADAAQQLLERLLERLRVQGLLVQGGRQRTDATCVGAAVRELNRLELVVEVETLRAAGKRVSPARRRRAVEHLQQVFEVSQRWAYQLVGQHPQHPTPPAGRAGAGPGPPRATAAAQQSPSSLGLSPRPRRAARAGLDGEP